MRAVVCGLSAELSPRRRTHARTWGVSGHATINRWVLKYAPPSEEAFHLRKRPVSVRWRLDETSIRIAGQWRYPYRAVKRVTRPIQGFKSFNAAPCTLTGMELMHMLRKGQREGGAEQGQTSAKQFYALAA